MAETYVYGSVTVSSTKPESNEDIINQYSTYWSLTVPDGYIFGEEAIESIITRLGSEVRQYLRDKSDIINAKLNSAEKS